MNGHRTLTADGDRCRCTLGACLGDANWFRGDALMESVHHLHIRKFGSERSTLDRCGSSRQNLACGFVRQSL